MGICATGAAAHIHIQCRPSSRSYSEGKETPILGGEASNPPRTPADCVQPAVLDNLRVSIPLQQRCGRVCGVSLWSTAGEEIRRKHVIVRMILPVERCEVR